MTYLFIGGPWDGRREPKSPEGIRFRVAVMRPLRITAGPNEIGAEEHEYRIMQFLPSAKPVTIWVHSSIGDDEVMERLIAGYNARNFTE